eukprot:1119576-Pleurochrysis_carterae.AAC.6
MAASSRGTQHLPLLMFSCAQLIATEDKGGADAQHVGLGRRLMAESERIARLHGFRRVAVIAGVGARGYYRKLGYSMQGEGDFLIKELPFFSPGWSAAWKLPAQGVCVALVVMLLAVLLLGACVIDCSRDISWQCAAAACVAM